MRHKSCWLPVVALIVPAGNYSSLRGRMAERHGTFPFQAQAWPFAWLRESLSRPKQSGGRVTTAGRKLNARGCLSPTKEVTGSQAGHPGAEGGASVVLWRGAGRIARGPAV